MYLIHGQPVTDIESLLEIGSEYATENQDYENLRQDTLEHAQQCFLNNRYDRDFLKRIWYKRKHTGIANITSNNISSIEFPLILPELKKITRLIAKNNDLKTYLKVLNKFREFKEKGLTKYAYKAVIARVFCTFHPNEHINWVDNRNIKFIENLFSEFPEFGISDKNDWFSISSYIRNEINKGSKSTINPEDVRRIISWFIVYNQNIGNKSNELANDSESELEKNIDALFTGKKTETTRLILSRLGQGKFKKNVIKVWGGLKECILTGTTEPSLLIASHIKGWSNSNDEERLDGANGFLLRADLDKLFDNHLITFVYNKYDFSIRLSQFLSRKEHERLKDYDIFDRHGYEIDDLISKKNIKRLIKYLKFHNSIFESKEQKRQSKL